MLAMFTGAVLHININGIFCKKKNDVKSASSSSRMNTADFQIMSEDVYIFIVFYAMVLNIDPQ